MSPAVQLLTETDLTSLEDVEKLRKSVAMLPANAYQKVLSREQTLQLLDALRAALGAIALD